MQRRSFVVGGMTLGLAALGCRGNQYARVIKPGEKEMVGSHQAGQETFRPLVDEAVGKLIGRHEPHGEAFVSTNGEQIPPPRMNICFVGVENKTSEEIGDFKEQLYEIIDSKLNESNTFQSVSRRFVDAGLGQLRLRPDQLFIPENQRMFAQVLEQQQQPFDYLLFAKLTSGTTRENKEYQRDYLLTMELINIHNGIHDKQSATISKGYHQSWMSRTWAGLGS